MTLREWPRRVAALAQIRVSDVAAAQWSDAARHHVCDVLRARDGEELVITDGAGAWAFAQVHAGALVRVSDVIVDPPPGASELYLAPLKGDRSEWAIAKATEIGVNRVVPLLSSRVVVKFRGDVRDKTLRRWRRVSDEAAAQSRRTYDLVIAEPVSIADVPAEVAVCDFTGSRDWSAVAAVAIGPEGGFAPGEWLAPRRVLSLGMRVLRAETAAVVAGALVVANTDTYDVPEGVVNG